MNGKVVRWLDASGLCRSSLANLDEVAGQGQLRAIILLSDRGARASTVAVDRAASAGHADVVEYLLRNRHEVRNHPRLTGYKTLFFCGVANDAPRPLTSPSRSSENLKLLLWSVRIFGSTGLLPPLEHEECLLPVLLQQRETKIEAVTVVACLQIPASGPSRFC